MAAKKSTEITDEKHIFQVIVDDLKQKGLSYPEIGESIFSLFGLPENIGYLTLINALDETEQLFEKTKQEKNPDTISTNLEQILKNYTWLHSHCFYHRTPEIKQRFQTSIKNIYQYMLKEAEKYFQEAKQVENSEQETELQNTKKAILLKKALENYKWLDRLTCVVSHESRQQVTDGQGNIYQYMLKEAEKYFQEAKQVENSGKKIKQKTILLLEKALEGYKSIYQMYWSMGLLGIGQQKELLLNIKNITDYVYQKVQNYDLAIKNYKWMFQRAPNRNGKFVGQIQNFIREIFHHKLKEAKKFLEKVEIEKSPTDNPETLLNQAQKNYQWVLENNDNKSDEASIGLDRVQKLLGQCYSVLARRLISSVPKPQ